MTLAKLMAAVAVSDLILHGGILGRAQNLFVANGDSDSIEKFNSSGVGTVFANTGLAVPNGLAFEPAPVPEPSAWALLWCALGALLAGQLGLRARAFGVAGGRKC